MKRFLFALLAPIAEMFPVSTVRLRYFLRFGRLPNLKNPQDLNEKILYQKLFTDTSQWTKLADKYQVRKYIESCGLASILVPLIGAWEKVEDIPFDKLPQKFIFKANNGDGKGTNIKVDKEKLSEVSWKNLRERLQGWLAADYIGALSAEPQYRSIKPLILVEELLPCDEGQTSLIDYKLWCFNGEPHSFLVCSNRHENGYETDLGCYDLQWNYLPQNLQNTSHINVPAAPLPRPKCLEQMIEIGRTLSKDFPQVRVDLYEVQGKVYFGELTFTSLGGMMNYYTPEYLKEMGAYVTI